MRSFRDKYKDPHLALAMFDHARNLSIASFVFGCTTPAYNELLETRWRCFRDLRGVADALDDVRRHELATAAAMRAAVHALLARLDPAALRRDAEAAGTLAVLPAQRKLRAWDAYEALYAGTKRALRDDFDAAFGKDFARAYEKVMREAGGPRERT